MKNANVDNTIKFIDKKAEYEGKNRISKLRISKLRDKNKVIGYEEHKKMKAHEAKKQKILNSNLYKFRKRIIAGIVITSSVFVGIFLWQKFFEPSLIQSKDNNFKVESGNLSNSDVSTYSSIIKESIQGTLDIKYKINIEQLHKNGNLIFAKGYFNIPKKGDINFDMILQNYSPYSLKINGNEYLKK